MLPLDIRALWKILPHRYPFLLVDKVIELDIAQGLITAIKNVTINEHFFQGHFPDAPIMPGVLILEALAQTGGILLHFKEGGGGDRIALLLNINDAKFRHPVLPGDQLVLKAELLHLGGRAGQVKARALVNNKIAVEAEIGFVLVSSEHLGASK